MYKVFKNVIQSGNFELSGILDKIDTQWVLSRLSDEERNSLVNDAREKAIPENSYNIQKQLETIFRNLSELSAKVIANTNEIKALQGVEMEPEETPEEYPEYVQPTGAHDAYNAGDKVIYNGKKYTCIMNGCVWNPDVYPQGWKLVE